MKFLEQRVTLGTTLLLSVFAVMGAVSSGGCATSTASTSGSTLASHDAQDELAMADPAEVARMTALVNRAEERYSQEEEIREQARELLRSLEGISGLPLMQRAIAHTAADVGFISTRVVPGPIRSRGLISESIVSVEARTNPAAVEQFLVGLEKMAPRLRVNAIHIRSQRGGGKGGTDGTGGLALYHVRVAVAVLIRGDLPPQTVLPPPAKEIASEGFHSMARYNAMRKRLGQVSSALDEGREEMALLQKGLDVVDEGRLNSTELVSAILGSFGKYAEVLSLRMSGPDQELRVEGHAGNDSVVNTLYYRLDDAVAEMVAETALTRVVDEEIPGMRGLRRVFTIEGILLPVITPLSSASRTTSAPL